MQLGFDAHKMIGDDVPENSPNKMSIYHQGTVNEEALIEVIHANAACWAYFFIPNVSTNVTTV